MAYREAPVTVSREDLRHLHAEPEVRGEELIRIRINGRCPRCEHTVEYAIGLKEWALEEGASVQVKSSEAVIQTIDVLQEDDLQRLDSLLNEDGARPREVALQCKCAHPHKAGTQGCGAWFMLGLSWDRGLGGDFAVRLDGVSRDAISGYDISAALDRDARTGTQLTRMRGAAEKLSTGLLAIAALIPGFLLVKGVDGTGDLSEAAREGLAVLLAVAVGGIVLAALILLRIAVGPMRLGESTDDALSARDEEIRRSSDNVKLASGAFLLGLAALIGASAIIVFANPAVPASFKVTRNDSTAECGTFAGTTTNDPPTLLVKQGQSTISIALSDVKSAAFAPSC
jgi:hypothetical protein